MEGLEIDLTYLFNKYDKKINPKYLRKIDLEKGTLLIYKSGLNILMRKDFDEDLL